MQFVSSFLGGYQKVSASDSNPNNIQMDEMGMDSQSHLSNMDSSNVYPVSSNPFGINTLSVTPLGQQSPTNDAYSSDFYSQQSTTEPSNSWFGSLWSTPQADSEMSTIYDVESQTTIQPAVQNGHAQEMPAIQRLVIGATTWVGKRMPPMPELTYTQKLTSFAIFAIGGLILLLNALMNLTSIFFGGSAKFALSLTMSNIFFIIASLFITSPASHFQPNRRFTTFLYLGTIVVTALASVYLPYAPIVLPLLAAQIAAMVFHILSFFTSAVNVNMNIGQSIVTSMFRQAL